MNLRCELCLKKNGWAVPIGNIWLVIIDGIETLVCRKHNPGMKKAEVQHYELKVANA